jgi:hypothetical protein
MDPDAVGLTAMASKPSQQPAAAPQPPLPNAVAPPAVASAGGGADYIGFVWQQLNDMRGTLGKLEGVIAQQTSAIEKLDDKLEKTKDNIHSINVTMKVAAAVVTVCAVVVGFVLNEVWGVLKPAVVQRLTAEPVPVAPAIPVARPPAAPAVTK